LDSSTGPDRAARRRRLEGHVALVVSQVFFGLFPVLVKLATDPGEPGPAPGDGAGFEPRAIAVWRILGGGLVLGTLAALVHGRAFLPRRSDLARLFACALLGIVANQLFALEGTARTAAVHAGILFTLIPVFTYAVAVGVRQERYASHRVLGIGVALVGVVLLVLARGGGGAARAPAPLLGDLLIVGNCLSYAIFLVLARPILFHTPSIVVVAWCFLLSFVALPFLARGVDLWPAGLAADALVGLGGLVLLATILGYLVHTWALARVAASTAAIYVYLQPLIATASAFVFLGERPDTLAYLAAGLLFLGIGLVNRRGGSRARLAGEGGGGRADGGD
jgi:drug/metabolite transporter (DMT)-like permease